MSSNIQLLLVGHGSLGEVDVDSNELLSSVRNKIVSKVSIPVSECIYFVKSDWTGIYDDLTREAFIIADKVINNDKSILMTPESLRPDSPPKCPECNQRMLWYPADHLTLSYANFNFASVTKVSHRRSNYVVAQYNSSKVSHHLSSKTLSGSISLFEVSYCGTVNCKNRGRLYDATQGTSLIRQLRC